MTVQLAESWRRGIETERGGCIVVDNGEPQGMGLAVQILTTATGAQVVSWEVARKGPCSGMGHGGFGSRAR